MKRQFWGRNQDGLSLKQGYGLHVLQYTHQSSLSFPFQEQGGMSILKRRISKEAGVSPMYFLSYVQMEKGLVVLSKTSMGRARA